MPQRRWDSDGVGEKIELMKRARTISPFLVVPSLKFVSLLKNNEFKFLLSYVVSYVVLFVDQSDMGFTDWQAFFRDL